MNVIHINLGRAGVEWCETAFRISLLVSVLEIGRNLLCIMSSVNWVLYALLSALCAGALRVGKERCDGDRLAVYKLHVETYWSPELFPKQYPEWRPPAQWSRIIGRSHDKSFTLFRVGQTASDGMKMFAETGDTDGLEDQSQGEGGVFDEFNGPSIRKGQGRSETEFFMDGNHTRVSVAVRIIPSPDWFIGLDSLPLCKNGYWIDGISVQAGPMDAGTDSGFTFTAPNWPSEPRQKVSLITAQHPSHPANSFYYPEKKELPSIATFRFYKDKVYQLSEESKQQSFDNRVHTMDDLESTLRQDEISNDVLPSIVNYQNQRRRMNKSRRLRKGSRRPVACHVSEWEAWSPCTVSCGIGEASRTRKVVKHARRGGRPCPPLEETKWCGEHTDCPHRFFNW